MNPVNPAKFGVAFAAGLVAALAGVMIYVKTSGIKVEEPTPAVAVRHVKQPENLSAGKVGEPKQQAEAPTMITPPVEEEKPALAASPATPAPKPVQGAPIVPVPQIARVHYPRHSLPESQSTIRVEVSQIKSTAPDALPSRPQPVPVRAVSDEQPTPAPAPYYPSAPVQPQPHVVTLQPGINVVMRMGETLSSDHNYSGDTFRGTLARPIVMDGFVIAEKGSKILGKITGIDKAGKFDGVSNLQLALTEINTTDGQRVRIQTGFYDKKGPSPNGGQEAAKVGGGAVLGAIIGAVAGGGKGAAIGAGAGGAIGAGAVMMGKGRPAVIPTEELLTFQLSAPTTITEHLN